MSKYEAVYFVGDNQAINRVRIDSSKTRNRGAISGSLAALVLTVEKLKSPADDLNLEGVAKTVINSIKYIPVGYLDTTVCVRLYL